MLSSRKRRKYRQLGQVFVYRLQSDGGFHAQRKVVRLKVFGFIRNPFRVGRGARAAGSAPRVHRHPQVRRHPGAAALFRRGGRIFRVRVRRAIRTASRAQGGEGVGRRSVRALRRHRGFRQFAPHRQARGVRAHRQVRLARGRLRRRGYEGGKAFANF